MPYEIERGRLLIDRDAWKLLQEINRTGNKIAWVDQKEWAENQKWAFPDDIPPRTFDKCDSICLWKMQKLLSKGFPAVCLRVMVLETETGGGHAVLCVATHDADYILDNRFVQVKTYDDLVTYGYKFRYKADTPGMIPTAWVAI